ncbi:hypothetical protein SD915_11165 [Lactobacillus crispatus]|jgi:hypothetical protein|uniref:Uncharacterized protein n=1 Tax=Lactobacillus crispatus FB077-07 TaxID=883092 RepID=K1MKW2_9LACO|nr:hypothetical protein [Lactobacillus crispatus]EKB63093.1 hypothetical protein HMPREF9249_02126 [Lactobacillus crispatus FB077-07]EKB63957.1 hypothetical protein HMPREF9250_00174 [Lactobacillus crispatus FB049-03]DAO82307.1 MAG TPA: hypothetical protein [Bacteriophage sp.]DAX36432.1 MAG TPA: hypothetical protein [Caudoviricetes sp.]MBI1713362.1 hypothetical protein [Lactobacillus crispatus]
MQADKRKRQIQMRSNDIMKYTAVINSLLTVGAQKSNPRYCEIS